MNWLALVLSVGGEGVYIGAVATIVYWATILNWLVSNSSALTAVGAIATAVAAVIGAAGLIVAAVAARAAVGQLRSQIETADATLEQVKLQRLAAQRQEQIAERDSLWKFSDQWRDEIAKSDNDGKSHLTRAYKALRDKAWMRAVEPKEFEGQADPDVVEVLNFFEGVAYMRRHGILGKELAWSAFAPNAIKYFIRSQDFITSYRLGRVKRSISDEWPLKEDSTYWEDFEWWYHELVEYDDLRKKQAKEREDQEKRANDAPVTKAVSGQAAVTSVPTATETGGHEESAMGAAAGMKPGENEASEPVARVRDTSDGDVAEKSPGGGTP